MSENMIHTNRNEKLVLVNVIGTYSSSVWFAGKQSCRFTGDTLIARLRGDPKGEILPGDDDGDSENAGFFGEYG